MKMRATIPCALAAALFANAAEAHVSVPGPGFANTTFEANFGVGHGCEGADVYRIKVMIPAGVSSVRPLDSTFGRAVVEKDGNGNIASITWTKPDADILAEDLNYYRVTVRMRLPDAPFTTIYFPTIQYCRAADGTERSIEWVGTGGGGHHHEGDAGTGGEDGGVEPEEPAPSLFILPARVPGWNKYTVQEHVHDLTVFKDAQIVWAGTAAYSFNPNTQALIAAEPGVQALSQIHPGTEIWVKY